MYIGNLFLISPALYLCVGAIVVLILGVIAAKRPDKGLDHWLPTQYLAPALMVPALFLAGGVLAITLKLGDVTRAVTLDGKILEVSPLGLFMTGSGAAQVTVDPFSAIFTFIAIAGTVIVMLLALDHFGEYQIHKAEFYSLLMFAAAAASFAASSSDLIALYLSIEFLSLVSYVLAAFSKTDRRSGEAGLKYFLYGAASSAIMLYGISILFGVMQGQTSFAAISRLFLGQNGAGQLGTAAGFVGMMFALVGFGFKLALVPFHFWAPDTYEGAPTPVTAFLSVVSKAAGLAVIVRFLINFAPAVAPEQMSWYWVLVVLTGLSMLYGNLVAIPQKNIKRMLAYSSIAQVGYMMIGVLVAMHTFCGVNIFSAVPSAAVRTPAVTSETMSWGMQGVIVYILAYLFMNLGAFAVVIAVGKRLESDSIEDYKGLYKRSPFYAASLAVFLFSLAGIPPLAGFWGKLFIFGGAVKVGMMGHPELVVLAALGVVNSVISVFYYFNIVRLMYFSQPESKYEVRGSFGANAAVLISLVLTIGIMFLVWPVSKIASAAVHAPPVVKSTQR